MENSITSERIANSIGLDKSFIGTYLLVEGKKDISLFRKFIDFDKCRIKPTFGKYKMKEVYDILTSRHFDNKIGIRDADFLRVKGNKKYNPVYTGSIYPTDCHDSEGMIINSGALEEFYRSLIAEETLESFENKYGKIRDLIYGLCYKIGCLRLANKRYDLGLSFKPKDINGNHLRYKKFICEKKLSYLGDEILVNTVVEYSNNRGKDVLSRSYIIEKINVVNGEKQPLQEIINGHDLSQALFIVLKKGLKCNSKMLQDAGCVEELLSLTYHYEYFCVTDLFDKLVSWQNLNEASVIKIK